MMSYPFLIYRHHKSALQVFQETVKTFDYFIKTSPAEGWEELESLKMPQRENYIKHVFLYLYFLQNVSETDSCAVPMQQ